MTRERTVIGLLGDTVVGNLCKILDDFLYGCGRI